METITMTIEEVIERLDDVEELIGQLIIGEDYVGKELQSEAIAGIRSVVETLREIQES